MSKKPIIGITGIFMAKVGPRGSYGIGGDYIKSIRMAGGCPVILSATNDPELILADEPTGNLDSKTSREILDILKFTNQKYKQTILLVTHDEKIALQANRIITIGDGKIIKDEVMK